MASQRSVDELSRPQAVPIRDQHRGGVAVAMAIFPGSSDQAGDLGVGQVFTRADLGVALAARRAPAIGNCPNNGGRRHQRQMRFCHDFQAFLLYCPINRRSWDTAQGEKCRFYGYNCDFGRAGRSGQRSRNAELAGRIFFERGRIVHGWTPPLLLKRD